MCWTCFLLLWSVSPLKWALGNRWATCQRNSGLLLESGASDSARTSWSCFRIRFVLTYLHSPSDPSLFSIDNKIEQKTQMMQRSSQQLWGWESQGFGCAGKFFFTSLVCFIPRWAQVWTWSWKHDLLSKLSPLFIRWHCGNQQTDSDLHKTLGLRQLGSASPPPQTQHCDKDEKNGWMLAKSCQNDRFV